MIGLLKAGANALEVDSDGRDVFMHAAILNDMDSLELLLKNLSDSQFNPNAQDKAGKTAAHYVVMPLKVGSYENLQMLRALHRNKFTFSLPDNDGRMPIYYASTQESGVMLKELQKMGVEGSKRKEFQRVISAIPVDDWPEPQVDYDNDAVTYMERAAAREERKAEKIPVDSTGNFEKTYEVYYENGEPVDTYLTKVDLKNGIYGEYVFYKMQVLYDSNRDLYVLFTRWGRIGESGMNQRTPFNSAEEAMAEFKKIFKQKTGNNWETSRENFEKQDKKYNLARVRYVTVDYKEYLAPFKLNECPPSKLAKPLQDLIFEISNVTTFQRALSNFGIDSKVLPFSALKKEIVDEARQILGQLSEVVEEETKMSCQGLKVDFKKLTEVREQLTELSSRYYELIPQQRYANQIAPPIRNKQMLGQEAEKLANLADIEFASKILLGALQRQYEMNPLDYIYKAINMHFELLDSEDPEHELVMKYIKNTWRNKQSGQQVKNIFRIQRKGEAE